MPISVQFRHPLRRDLGALPYYYRREGAEPEIPAEVLATRYLERAERDMRYVYTYSAREKPMFIRSVRAKVARGEMPASVGESLIRTANDLHAKTTSAFYAVIAARNSYNIAQRAIVEAGRRYGAIM